MNTTSTSKSALLIIWSVFTAALKLAIGCFMVWVVVSCSRAAAEHDRKMEVIYQTCPVVAKTCTVEKTQMAKFGHITRFDYETYACQDGKRYARQVRSTTLLSTYLLYFVDQSATVTKLATQHHCEAR